jgi:Aspartyl protease
MLFSGSWWICNDGVVRPTLPVEVVARGNEAITVRFLIDTGADRTVLSADVLKRLNFEGEAPEQNLRGVGGDVQCVTVPLTLRMQRENGHWVTFDGEFAAFTDPAALDMSVLGRDITNLFALIVDRPQDLVCMVTQRHGYTIVAE